MFIGSKELLLLYLFLVYNKQMTNLPYCTIQIQDKHCKSLAFLARKYNGKIHHTAAVGDWRHLIQLFALLIGLRLIVESTRIHRKCWQYFLADVVKCIELVSELNDAVFCDTLFHQRPWRIEPTGNAMVTKTKTMNDLSQYLTKDRKSMH